MSEWCLPMFWLGRSMQNPPKQQGALRSLPDHNANHACRGHVIYCVFTGIHSEEPTFGRLA